MILEVQIQICGTPAHARQSFHFQKIPGGLNIKDICASIAFKAESKPKDEDNIFFYTKNTLFQGSKVVVFKTQLSNLFFCVCSFM